MDAGKHQRRAEALATGRAVAVFTLGFGTAVSLWRWEGGFSVRRLDNEGKALEAVLRFIESRDNTLRENDGWSPDDPKDPDPDEQRRVDYVCTVGRLIYAFEHTRVEPFSNQIRLEDHNQKLFGPIIERFDHRGDQEIWDLLVPRRLPLG